MKKPDRPSHETMPRDTFRLEDLINPAARHGLIHAERRGIRMAVRQELDRIEPLLLIAGGLCYFKTYVHDAEFRVLVTNHDAVAGPDNTVVSVNKIRVPDEDDEYFPDGQTMELTDLNLPTSHQYKKSRWLNSSWNTLSRGQHTHRWPAPEYASILQVDNDTIRAFGQLSIGNFRPKPAVDIRDVEDDVFVLWRVHDALSVCNATSHEEGVTQIAL